MNQQKLILLLIAVLIVVSLTVNVNSETINAKTLPLSGEEKPSDFIIFLPFKDKTTSNMVYYSYGSPESNHFNSKYYAIDFNLGKKDVYPIAKGHITFSDFNPSYGNVVVIEHSEAGFPKYVSVYAHLEKIYQYGALGTVVNPNSPIGLEGKTGSGSNGIDHLHFELRRCSAVPYGGLPSNNTDVCKSVVPEPFVGKNVYEGFGWWHELNKSKVAEGAARPLELDDQTPPDGKWTSAATLDNSSIVPGKPIVFDLQYWDLETGIGEVRLTAGYTSRKWTG